MGNDFLRKPFIEMAHLREAATQHDDFGIDDVHEAAKRTGEAGDVAVQAFLGASIAGSSTLNNGLRGHCLAIGSFVVTR